MRRRSNKSAPGANELDDEASISGSVVDETNDVLLVEVVVADAVVLVPDAFAEPVHAGTASTQTNAPSHVIRRTTHLDNPR